jgi:hypothetical protein
VTAHCRGCGKAFRKGRVFSLLSSEGTLAPIVGCQDCARRAVMLLADAGPDRSEVLAEREWMGWVVQ